MPLPFSLKSTERVAIDDRACARAIDVNIAGFQAGFNPLDASPGLRDKKPPVNSLVGSIRDFERLVEITYFLRRLIQGPNISSRAMRMFGFDIGENCRRNKIAMRRNFLCLISQCGLFLTDFDVFQNAPISRLIHEDLTIMPGRSGLPIRKTRLRPE